MNCRNMVPAVVENTLPHFHTHSGFQYTRVLSLLLTSAQLTAESWPLFSPPSPWPLAVPKPLTLGYSQIKVRKGRGSGCWRATNVPGCQGQVKVILRGAGRKAQSRAQPPCCLSPTFASAVFFLVNPLTSIRKGWVLRGSRNGAKTVEIRGELLKCSSKVLGKQLPKGVGRENGHSCPLCRFPAYPQ